MIHKASSIFMGEKALICNNALFTEQDCVKTKIGLQIRQLKTNKFSAHVYIE